MRSKDQRLVFVAVAAVLIGAGYLLHTWSQNNLRRQLTEERQKVVSQLNRLKEANQEARENAAAAAAQERATRNEAKKAEAAKAKSENERAAAEANAAAQQQEKENIEGNRKLAQEETVRAEKAAAAAAAEQKRLEAEKAASEAKEKELVAQRAKDELTHKTSVELHAKAEADAARALAEQKKAEAEKVKSANDLKAAEKRAAARRDERLLMYKRGGTSEAERKEVQHAEKMLALWEAGMLTPENLAAANALPAVENVADQTPVAEEDPAIAEEKNKLKKQEPPPPPPDPQDEKIKALGMAREKRLTDERNRVASDIVARIEPLLRAAESEGRTRDVAYYRSVLQSLVPGYGTPQPDAKK